VKVFIIEQEIKMIKIFDPVDENKKYFVTNNYIQKEGRLFVRTDFSNCLLELQIEKDGKLSCPYTKETLGRII
jgi:hypothetical protein